MMWLRLMRLNKFGSVRLPWILCTFIMYLRRPDGDEHAWHTRWLVMVRMPLRLSDGWPYGRLSLLIRPFSGGGAMVGRVTVVVAGTLSPEVVIKPIRFGSAIIGTAGGVGVVLTVLEYGALDDTVEQVPTLALKETRSLEAKADGVN